jgi:allantoinase
VIDARGLHVLPGAVDAHVHLNEPGRTSWEGFASGTRALAAGGVTSAIDMPLNALPPTVDADALAAKRRCLERDALVDVALWGGLVPGNLDVLDELAAGGVVGFKAFMSSSGTEEFARADDLTLYEGMQRAAKLGLPVAVHAESETITAGLAARARAAGRVGVRDYLASRPVVAETEAIARAIALAREAGCSLHVVHVSTGHGVALVSAARAAGVDVTCETCPHYLVLTDADAERIGALAKCAPPLRPAAELEGLWSALACGEIDFVASDHSPAPMELKRGKDAFAWWGGISGAQTLLPLVLSEGSGRGVPLETLADVVATAPARRFRLPGKGRLEPGADADLVLVDLMAEQQITPQHLQYRHRHSPFVGRSPRARVVRTVLRGRSIWDGAGEIAAPCGGRFLIPDKEPRP